MRAAVHVTVVAICLLSTPVVAAGPAMSRAELALPIAVDDCMRRAERALTAEGWQDIRAEGSLTAAQKDLHSVNVLCSEGANGVTVVNIIVASATDDDTITTAERRRLLAHIAEAPPQPPLAPAPEETTVTAPVPVPAAEPDAQRDAPLAPAMGPLESALTSDASAPDETNLALNKPATQSSLSQWSNANDAQGGVDGMHNGAFGFHTQKEADPWWQVDLGQVTALREVRVFNRVTCCRERARALQVLLSGDGEDWTTAYVHDGTAFGGADGHPLVVSLRGSLARYVRVQLAETTTMHLDEIEVYGE